MSIESSTKGPPKTPPELLLTPVFGKGREARWETFQKILREKIAPFLGSQEELIQEMRKADDMKCRLLLADDQPMGVLIYRTTLVEIYGVEDCIKIETLFSNDPEQSESPKQSSAFLLKEVIYEAKKLKAASLCLRISNQAAHALQFFTNNNFIILHQQHNMLDLKVICAEPAQMSIEGSAGVSPKKAPELLLKPVFGEGREARWETFQKILREKIAPFLGSQEELIQEVRKANDMRCRLLLADDQPMGVLIYRATLVEMYGVKDCIKIETLFSNDQEQSGSPKEFSAFLLKEVLYEAKKLKASSLCVRISNQAVHALQFFANNNFIILHQQNNMLDLSKVIRVEPAHLESGEKEPGQLKRKQDHDGVSLLSSKKQKTNEGRAPIRRSYSEPGESNNAGRVNQMEIDACPIAKIYIFMIKEKTKTIDGRVNVGAFRRLRENHFIRFENGSDSVVCNVEKLVKYNSFKDMFSREGYQLCLPDARSLENAVDIYRSIPGYAQKERLFGVLSIHLQVIV